MAFVAILLTLAWRLRQVADFSDESYYAIFIDDWLKAGIHSSALLMLHQTAALVVYPMGRVFPIAARWRRVSRFPWDT
jgi:hypothetical protein